MFEVGTLRMEGARTVDKVEPKADASDKGKVEKTPEEMLKEAVSDYANPTGTEGEDESGVGAATEPVAEPQENPTDEPAAAPQRKRVKLADFDEVEYADGKVVSRDDLGRILPDVATMDNWRRGYTERDQALAQERDYYQTMEREGWARVRQRAASDPRWYQEQFLPAWNAGLKPAEDKDMVKPEEFIPEGFNDDVAWQESAKKTAGIINRLQRQNKELLSARDNEIRQALVPVEHMKLYMGSVSLEQQKQAVEAKLKELGVANIPETTQRILDVAYQNRMDVWNPNGNDAFKSVTWDILARRVGGTANGTQKKPQPTMPAGGSVSSGRDTIKPEERGAYNLYLKVLPKGQKPMSPSEWRKMATSR